MTANTKELTSRVNLERGLGADSLVVEVASNDGYLIQDYVGSGIPVLGIDPAKKVVGDAKARRVLTLCTFFSEELAQDLRAEGRRAELLHATKVIAYVPDVNGVFSGIRHLLATA